MVLPTSGPLSLNDIHIEAGGSSGTTASLNDADIRGLIGKASGAQNAISEYYGASATPEIRFEVSAANGGDASPNTGGAGGKTLYTVQASSGTQFNIYAGGRGSDGNTTQGGGGGAGNILQDKATSVYLVIVGGGGAAGYFGGNGGSGGAVNSGGLTGQPAYTNGGGNGGGGGTGGDESANNVRYAGVDGDDWSGGALFGAGGEGGGTPSAGGGAAPGFNVNQLANGGQGGDAQATGDSGGGGGGGGYGGGAGGATLASNGLGAGGGGGGGFARTTGMPAGVTYVSATGTTGGSTVSGGGPEVKVYVDNVLNTTYTAGFSTFTVP